MIAANNATDAPSWVVLKEILTPFLSFIRVATPIHLDGGVIRQSTLYRESTKLGEKKRKRKNPKKRRKGRKKRSYLVTLQSRY